MTGSQNVFEYENTIGGFGVALAWDTEIDDSRTADEALALKVLLSMVLTLHCNY